jgi:hypothetical protein
MMEKGQVERAAGSDAQGQAKFVASLFQSRTNQGVAGNLLRSKINFATRPVDLPARGIGQL